jgi:dTDP-4-dehydrorhamnose reductase/beta-phosphoglucomutase-like phosphatase (HAD superfamily)
MTILICGASGLVGRDLCDLFERENINYYGTYHSCNDETFCERENMFRVDFTNPSEVADFFSNHKQKLTVCIFLVVQRLVDVCENDWNSIMRVNINAVDMTSSLCARYGIYFIHLSTDYVFDGSSSPYFPDSTPNPLQNYGISKYISELRVQANYNNNPNYCIIRTPVLYSMNTNSILYDNAVTVLAKNVMDLRTYTVKNEDDYHLRRPVYIPDLCLFIRAIALLSINYLSEEYKFSGIYHYYHPDNCFTKYQMTVKIANCLGLPHLHIIPFKPDYTEERLGMAKRPYDTNLKDTQYNISSFSSSEFDSTIECGFSRFKHPRLGTTGSSYFLMFDLDGTLVHTSYAHYRSYLHVFRNRNLPFMTYQEWNRFINYKNIHTYLENIACELANHDITETQNILSDLRNEKLEAFRIYALTYVIPTKNCHEILDFIEKNPDTVNAVVVTNSSKATIDVICEIVPILNKIKNWCFRETYTNPKPHPESYDLALNRYYKNEQYIIGFENTNIGYESLKHSAKIIYLYVDNDDEYSKTDKWYYKKDAYIFDDYKQVVHIS